MGGGFEKRGGTGLEEFVGEDLAEGERSHIGTAGFMVSPDGFAGGWVGDDAEDLLPLA